MPIAKNLSKVQKKVSGKEAQVHPRARKFKQLNKATLRQEKLEKNKAKRHTAQEAKVLRTRYFQQVVNLSEKEAFDLAEMKEFVEAFISRDDAELAKLKAERRPGRPASNRQDILESRIKADKREFKTGYLMPNLNDAATVKAMRAWKGEYSGTNTFKMIRITDEMTELPTVSGDIAMEQ
ncbi:hypothetical protein TRVA0_003S03444 [Trichomonascus vanleenenianus]|uniref:Tma16p n=1 Tax=Trichomonascus vanleenenianus TaxID=2268995 RepID=UPI003EC986D4